MRVIKPGYKYELDHFEGSGVTAVQFIEKEKVVQQFPAGQSAPSTDLVTINDGTTNEEVLCMLIDRMRFLQAKCPCRENAIVITKLEESLMWLEYRTADRKARGVEGKPTA